VWVIDRTNDAAFLIGGALVAFAFLAAHAVLGVAAVTIYVVWVLAIDGPHVFATISRTYLDAEERRSRTRLLRGSLAFFAFGPAAVGAAIALGTRLPYDLFLLVCTVWAYWHVVRQHYGVMVLYQRKAGAGDALDERIDALFLYVGLLAPVLAYAVANDRTLGMLGFAEPPSWAGGVPWAAWTFVAAAGVLLVARQVVRARAARPVHWTKLLFLAAATSVSIVLFSAPVAARVEYAAIVPIVTSFHDVQYLAIVWFFHRNRSTRQRARRDAPPAFLHRVSLFLGLGIVFTLFYRVGLGCLFSAWPGCSVGADEMALPAGLTVSDLGVAFLWDSRAPPLLPRPAHLACSARARAPARSPARSSRGALIGGSRRAQGVAASSSDVRSVPSSAGGRPVIASISPKIPRTVSRCCSRTAAVAADSSIPRSTRSAARRRNVASTKRS
jgi:hypothetical protein